MKSLPLIPLTLLLVSPAAYGADGAPLTGLVVCVDPGHTSETSAGTSSQDGRLSERHVNWLEAVRLRSLLTQAGAKVVMTKAREDDLVTNRRRAETANDAHADLLLRLHCDAGPQSGFATFYPDRQGTRFGVTGPSPEVIGRSRQAAAAFHTAAAASLRGSLPDLGIKGDSATFVGGKQGALTGSIFAHVPALTVEMCVLTNAHDYAFIRTAQGQEKMAQALLTGTEAFQASSQKEIARCWVETDDGDLVNLDHAAAIEFREHHGPQDKISSYTVFAEMGEGSKQIRTFRVDRPTETKTVERQARAFMSAIREAFNAKDSLVPWDKSRTP